MEEQRTSCTRSVIWQWVTMTEITIENCSRPGIEATLMGSGAWTLRTCLGLVVSGSSSHLLGVWVMH